VDPVTSNEVIPLLLRSPADGGCVEVIRIDRGGIIGERAYDIGWQFVGQHHETLRLEVQGQCFE
jgi:hypothetical protein